MVRIVGADRLPAATIAFLYALLGIAWIELTDRAVSAVARDAATLTALQTYKAWVFVLGTAVVLYLLVRGMLFLRRRALDTQAEKDRFFATLMKNLPGMAYRCRTDPEWTMEYMSFGVGPLTGYAEEEFTARRSVSWAALIHPDDRERVRSEIGTAVERRRRFRVEYRIRTRGGDTKRVWEQGTPIFSDSGEPEALEGFILDVSARVAGDGAAGSVREATAPPPASPLGRPPRRPAARLLGSQ